MVRTKYFFSGLLILLCVSHRPLLAQNASDRAYIQSKTHVNQLKAIAAKLEVNRELMIDRMRQFDSVIVYKSGQRAILSGLDREGNPVYDSDDNFTAALTSRVDKIWKGSSLDLSGCGIEIGHWEAIGLALASHRELAGRIEYAESVESSSHATHTAGTMIGTGLSNGARGMAPCATIVARRSDNDIAELALFAAEGGILSNHSYGRGNPDGNITGYGQYSQDASALDEVLFNAPYLTMTKSAGNTRDDGVNEDDQGYDVLFTMAMAKNLLVVGGVDDVPNYTTPQAVRFYASSSWGPTDDWRIKPDLSANAVEVFSASNEDANAYDTKSGTSMSTPVVTGTVALLQEYYHNQNGVYMKAATVKALLLNTTNELGEHEGPDFQNGWGLLNAEKAAMVISQNADGHAIRELQLMQGETYTTTIEADGSTSLFLTIAWTDPPSGPIAGTDNQFPVLINDLDVRISGNGETYEPWVLTPNSTSNNFTHGAGKGDNFRDNVERIDIGLLPAGSYTVTVTNKGTLVNGLQDFAMVMSTEESIVTSVEEEALANAVLLYPNPSNGEEVKLVLSDDLNASDYGIVVMDMRGQEVFNQLSQDKETTIHTQSIRPGLYFVIIRADDQVIKKRLIIER